MNRSKNKIVILHQKEISDLGSYIQNFFDADTVSSVEGAFDKIAQNDTKVLIFDCVSSGSIDIEACESLLKATNEVGKPLVILSGRSELKEKLKIYQIGCDDLLDTTITGDEACARVNKSIFHRIANDQLSSRLELANATANSVMSDNSDLGANIQFLLAVHNCDNLDQLGQQFFATIERYGLSCSLQMRSEMGVKNMEAHGMAKDLESQLLTQLMDSGRYVDFGARTIVNYNRVSLLIKNMPVDDPEKYGTVKDNTFSLLQGISARVVALEDKHRLVEEREALKLLSGDISAVITNIQDSYQQVMRSILNEVEQCSELVMHRIPSLALTEKDEKYLENLMERVVKETNRTFNQGLAVDDCFQKLESNVAKAISLSEPPKTDYNSYEVSKPGIELF